MSKAGVVLCECNGTVERRISLREVTHFLNDASPSFNVILGNNLCKKSELKRLLDKSDTIPSVICACDAIDNNLNFWQEIKSATINPYFTKVIDVLTEIDSDSSSSDVTNRVKLLIWSKILRSLSCNDIAKDNLKTRFDIPKAELSRRELVGALVPQYKIVPYILPSDCAGGYLCGLCKTICPAKAIIDDITMRIDKSACSGCGACMGICPHEAISYPSFSILELEREAEGLLSSTVTLSPRIIAVTCQPCAGIWDKAIMKASPHVFTLEVPSLAMASPLLLLTILNKGANGIVLIDSSSECASKATNSSWRDSLRFVQDLLDIYGIERERIGYIEVGPDYDVSRLKLRKFVNSITKLGPTPLKASTGSAKHNEIVSLSWTIKNMHSKLPDISENILKNKYVPFGMIKIKGERCTGCGLCAKNCPTNSISVKSVDDNSRLEISFCHDKCLACGICANTCPEKCINLTNMLDLSKLGGEQNIIFEDDYICCRNCRKIIAPKSMINILKSKLEQSGGIGSEWSELCPSCRVVFQQKR